MTRPSLKADAGNAVKSIEGVERVNNQIEVLPVSQFDNTRRLRLYRAIYGFGQLQKYAFGVNKPIRIIVKNGRVTLEGLVDNTVDRDIAEIQAKGVPDGGTHIAKTVVEFARRNQVTQIFVAHSQAGFLERLRGKNFAEDIVRFAQDLQVTVVADRNRRQAV